MNNIYKVIWSKAKNCYVVASEIARSHTKSATGSEKIGGVTKRSLLASLMALSLLCGGLGVAEATVHVNEGTGVIHEVYTTVETYSRELADAKLDLKADKTDVATNTANINNLDGKLANLTTTVNGKADKTYVDTAVAGAVATAGTNVDNKLEDYYNKATVDGKITAEENARNNAITTAIGLEREDRDAAIGNAITREIAARNQEIHNAIEQEKTNREAAVNNAKMELQGKIDKNSQDIETLDKSSVKYDNPVAKDTITLAGSDGTKITHLKDAALNDSSTDAVTGKQLNKTNEDLAAEVTARTNKDEELEGKINDEKAARVAEDTKLSNRIGTVDENGNYIKKSDTKNVSENLKLLDTQAKTNADAIAATDKRTKGITRETDGTTTTTRIEGNVTVDNSGNVGGVKELTAETIKAKTITTTNDANIGGALNVTGASNLNGNVTLGTNAENTVTVNGKADFKAAVNMDNGLTVTNGDTTLQKTTVNGTLTVNETANFNAAVNMNNGLNVTNGATKLKETNVEGKLDVSDTDGNNKANLSVKAGEGVKASATDGTTTGSLDVKADEVVSSVKDADGKGSTFKQRIDAIMMESKDVSINAEGTLTNEAKDIVTNASNSITEKVGETNVMEKTTTSSKSEIQNTDTITSVQQTDSMVQSYVGKKDGSATNVTTNFANASANMVTENGQSSTVLNNKDGLLIRNTANVNGFTTVDRTTTGTAREWTNIKGNEISTGKVEADYVKMGYADVMHDLGVRGNAKIDGKTTTGSLEVTGTSKLTGDVTMENNATVGKNLTVNGITTTRTLKVTENATVGGTLEVTKKATFSDDVDIAKNLSVGGNATIAGDVTANSYKVGDKTYIDANGIHANDQKITNVADGSISEGSKDAVNGGQLYGVKRDLEHQVDKVGANAAAMANLRPMEFDPSSKWNIAAAIGNYGSETAAALGAFYRPNDDVMVNLSTAFGTGENMVGGGVSVRLGKGGNKLSREENNALKDQVNDLTARMDALLSVLNPNMSKDFPDVPENHWAYEAVSRLAGNDIVQGYPDGEFHGERTMTRYEMAEIIYNALSRGAEAEKELVEEFKPELQAMAASEKATAERAEG